MAGLIPTAERYDGRVGRSVPTRAAPRGSTLPVIMVNQLAMNTTANEAPTNWREGRRLRTLDLHERGWPGKAIADALGVTTGAVSQWLTRAREGGREALRHRPPPGPARRLSAAQQQQLPTLLARGAEAHGFIGDACLRERTGGPNQRGVVGTLRQAEIGCLGVAALLAIRMFRRDGAPWKSLSGYAARCASRPECGPVRRYRCQAPRRSRRLVYARGSRRGTLTSWPSAEANPRHC